MSLVIFLLVLGIVLVIVEILLFTGIPVVGLIGMGSMGYGVWLAYSQLDTTTANVIVISAVVLLAILVYLSLKSKTWRKVVLDTEITSSVDFSDMSKLKVGDKGVAHSRLASVGKGQFDDNIYEVYAFDGLIEEGKHIEIVKIEDNKIFVKTSK